MNDKNPSLRERMRDFNKPNSLADELVRIRREKGAVIFGFSLNQILVILEKIHIAGINSPFTDEDIKGLKITI